ncbi:MAG: hypothetical protein Q9175_003923 [Cornicularia normoerica]
MSRLTVSCKVDVILKSNQHLPEPLAVSTAQSALPVMHRKSPFKMPFLRSSTSPLPSRPASPVLHMPQDCAFPPFPARSQSTTPTTPLESSFNFSLKTGSPQERVDIAAGQAQLNPRANGGGNLIHRMNSVVPGPFKSTENEDFKPSGHRESPSMGSSRESVKIPRSTSPKTHVQRPSTSSSNYTRHPSFSTVSAGPRSSSKQDQIDVPDVPSIPRPSFQDAFDGSAQVLPSLDFGSFGHENRSHTFPKNDRDAAPFEPHLKVDRLHSELSTHSHKPRPSVAVAAMQPLCEIGSTSSFKPSRSVRGRAVSPVVDKPSTAPSVNAHATDSRDDRRLGDAPTVPMPSQAAGTFGHDNPCHKPQESTSSNESYSSVVVSSSSISTPHESTSSNESYNFGMKGDNTRSSPPLNEVPKYPNAYASVGNQASDMFKGFIFDVEEPSTLEEPVPVQEEQPGGYLHPSRTDDPAPLRPMKATIPPNEDTPVRKFSPAMSPNEYIFSSFASQTNNLRVSPVPPAHSTYPEPSARRPSPANKGTCRGCGDHIRGKSVSSADGRLTGRYHKHCFVCHTCQRPFPTADFYVLNNQPYCALHYHELNGSLCTNCDRGIEGQYLETEMQQKFHPYCFSCQDCHIILRDDYFEFNGKTLCEQHAFGAAHTSTPSSLGPGRRFPERRTTRLMMM